MTPFALLSAVLPTPNAHAPSDPVSIVLIVFVAAMLLLAIRAGIRYFRSRDGRNGGDQE